MHSQITFRVQELAVIEKKGMGERKVAGGGKCPTKGELKYQGGGAPSKDRLQRNYWMGKLVKSVLCYMKLGVRQLKEKGNM